MASLATRAYWNAFTLWHASRDARLPYQPLDAVRRVQDRRVRAIVRHAFRHVPFYRDAAAAQGLDAEDFRTAADLAQLPLIDGSVLAERPGRFHAGGDRGPELTLDSSGTSGRSKQIAYDARALFLTLAHGHRQREVFARFIGSRYGYRELVLVRPGGVNHQIRHFYESHSWIPRRVDLERAYLTPGELSIAQTAAEMTRRRPDLLCGYGSYIGALFREARRHGLEPHRPKLIQYGGDLMPDADRRLIEEDFGIPVISTYQAAEALRIGFQCEQRRGLHLSIDSTAVRVVDDAGREVGPGESGHIVVSNLVNRATVLLNYRLGDRVVVAAEPCPCGRSLPLIERIEGRSDDLLELPGGRLFHGLAAVVALQRTPAVQQVQIVQRSGGEFLLRVVPQPAAAVEPALLERAFLRSVGLPDSRGRVAVEQRDAIPPEPGGKVKAVVRERQPSGEAA